jgi:CheY-like chemotaxis protein
LDRDAVEDYSGRMTPALKYVIVDDDPDWIELICRSLSGSTRPLTMVKFNDGQAALEHLKREHADLVITDLRMPKVDGLTLNVPIILVSSDVSVANEAIAHGASAFLRKGALKQDLMRTVKEVTALSHRATSN